MRTHKNDIENIEDAGGPRSVSDKCMGPDALFQTNHIMRPVVLVIRVCSDSNRILKPTTADSIQDDDIKHGVGTARVNGRSSRRNQMITLQ